MQNLFIRQTKCLTIKCDGGQHTLQQFIGVHDVEQVVGEKVAVEESAHERKCHQ